jgi:hypothetical protein
MNRTRAAAELVLRYLTARALFRQTPWEMPPNLEYLIGRGVRLLPGGVLINEVLLARTPAIIDDRKDPLFWSAIIGGEQDVIEMTPEEQEQVRQFILDENWTLPVMAWEHRSLRHKLAALGAALVGERSMGEKTRRVARWRGIGPFSTSRTDAG